MSPPAPPGRVAWSPRRLGRGLLWAYSSGVLLFLTLPIIAVVPLSFSAGSFLTYPLPGFSLRWYEAVLTSTRWLDSIRNSLVIGGAATGVATVLGTLAAVGLARGSFPGRGLVMAVVVSPMIVPVVITAVGVYFLFAPLGLTSSYLGMILAHAAIGVPFVVITVSATLQGFDPTLLRAAASLGAGPLRAFRRVTLPLILPGVLSGALFAFATSFDDVVIALFIAGPVQRTLPRQMFEGLREYVDPSIVAVATMLVVLSIALLGTIEWLRHRAERARAGADRR
jgi:putative spermidine/putrescine transport system permease protein